MMNVRPIVCLSVVAVVCFFIFDLSMQKVFNRLQTDVENILIKPQLRKDSNHRNGIHNSMNGSVDFENKTVFFVGSSPTIRYLKQSSVFLYKMDEFGFSTSYNFSQCHDIFVIVSEL